MVTSESISEILGTFEMSSWRRWRKLFGPNIWEIEVVYGVKKEINILWSIKLKTVWWSNHM